MTDKKINQNIIPKIKKSKYNFKQINKVLKLKLKKSISKPNFSLPYCSAEIPSPQGMIYIEWELKKKELLKITVPKGILIKLYLKSLNSSKEIKINDTIISDKTLAKNVVELGSGAHNIKF